MQANYKPLKLAYPSMLLVFLQLWKFVMLFPLLKLSATQSCSLMDSSPFIWHQQANASLHVLGAFSQPSGFPENEMFRYTPPHLATPLPPSNREMTPPAERPLLRSSFKGEAL